MNLGLYNLREREEMEELERFSDELREASERGGWYSMPNPNLLKGLGVDTSGIIEDLRRTELL